MQIPGRMPDKVVHQQGTVQGFNVSPHGTHEGFLLQTKTELVQINFPREWATAVADLAPVGSEVQVEARPEKEKGYPSHPVYQLIRMKNGNQNEFLVAASNGQGSTHFSGTVERLNYALHGELNGGILNTGDFLHLKPQGAAALEIAVGMEVKGIGLTKPMIGGCRVIEAEEVNGIKLEGKPKPRNKAHG